MSTEDVTPSARLARLVRERREAVEMTQRDLADAAGLGLSTIQSIERGTGGAPSKATRDGLERGLRWRKGSVAQVLEGGDPIAIIDELLRLEGQLPRRVRELVQAEAEFHRLKGSGAPADAVLRAQQTADTARRHVLEVQDALAHERQLVDQADAAEIESIPDAVLLRELERRLAQRHAPAFDDVPVGGDQYDFDLAAHTDPDGYVRDGDRGVAPDEGA